MKLITFKLSGKVTCIVKSTFVLFQSLLEIPTFVFLRNDRINREKQGLVILSVDDTFLKIKYIFTCIDLLSLSTT